jgi:hypothetical protein
VVAILVPDGMAYAGRAVKYVVWVKVRINFG